LLGLIAEHGTTVVNERENDWPLREKVAKLDVAARFIAESKIERQTRIELGLEADVAESSRHVL
jgi:trehalose-6-phosphatase